MGELRYKPYGETRYTWGTTPTDRRFTGQREEASLGSLYDYGARFYSSVLARFLSADTIVPSPGNPQSLNRYSYVYNNPVKYQDSDGHFPIIPMILAWKNIGRAIDAYNAGERRVGALALHATGTTGALVQAAEDVNRLNQDTSVVFSDAPLGERLPHCVHLGVWATETAGTVVAVGQVAAMIKGVGTQSMQFRYDRALGPGDGITSYTGDIRISPKGTTLDQTQALFHEQVHSWLSPKGPLLAMRAELKRQVYRNSHLARYTEEALAESVAQLRTGGSLLTGLRYPLNGYRLEPARAIIEGMTLWGGVVGVNKLSKRLAE